MVFFALSAVSCSECFVDAEAYCVDRFCWACVFEIVFVNFAGDAGYFVVVFFVAGGAFGAVGGAFGAFDAGDDFLEVSRAVDDIRMCDNYVIGVGREVDSLVCGPSVAEVFFVWDDD